MKFLRFSLTAALLATLVHATSVVAPSFAELVAEADCIVRGTVTAVEVRSVETPRGPAVRTFVTLAIAECAKGTAPQQLTLTLAGGTLGPKTTAVAGLPQFHVGDREILFVQGNGRQFCPLVGLHHGRYRVLTDATTRRDYVARDNGVPLTATSEVSLPALDPARMTGATRSAADGLAPNDFLARVRTQLQPADARALR
jgi:hypothetical protein